MEMMVAPEANLLVVSCREMPPVESPAFRMCIML